MKKSKILILGGSGYIGSVLTKDLLIKGYEVTVFDNLSFNQLSLLECCAFSKFNFIYGDIRDYKKVNKLLSVHDVILPLAAIVGQPAADKYPLDVKIINYESYINIIDNLSQDQICIFPSTQSGYGKSESDSYCDENYKLNPISLYGRSKVDIEKILLKNKNYTSFRLATVFGVSPRMRIDLLVNDFTYRAFMDKYLVLFEHHFRRNFIHVRDVAGVFIYAIENYGKFRGEIFNVGLSDANLTKKELAEKIKEYIPDLKIIFEDIYKDPDQRDYLVSNKKIENTGWKPNHSLDFGIQELIKAFTFIQKKDYTNL